LLALLADYLLAGAIRGPHTFEFYFLVNLFSFFHWKVFHDVPQVLMGDLKPAIEQHEVLYQITKRHHFLPEAVTSDFQVSCS
jgi:hypothetical protein